MKRTPLGPGRKSLERGSTFATRRKALRRNRRPPRSRDEQLTPKQRHRAEVFSRDPHVCAIGPHDFGFGCRGDLQADHILEVAWLRELDLRRHYRTGEGLAEDFGDIVADGRNGWILCERHHGLKTNGLIVIRNEWLPQSVFDFNDDYDCAHLMENRAVFA